jgi:hypothetical protein
MQAISPSRDVCMNLVRMNPSVLDHADRRLRQSVAPLMEGDSKSILPRRWSGAAPAIGVAGLVAGNFGGHFFPPASPWEARVG